MFFRVLCTPEVVFKVHCIVTIQRMEKTCFSEDLSAFFVSPAQFQTLNTDYVLNKGLHRVIYSNWYVQIKLFAQRFANIFPKTKFGIFQILLWNS